MPEYQTFYRIVRSNPPTLDDVRSYEELGIEPRGNDPEASRLFRGISLYNTRQQARNQAAGRPWRGNAFIAELQIPGDAPVTIERTGTRRGHYTLWGNPHDILALVTAVQPV